MRRRRSSSARGPGGERRRLDRGPRRHAPVHRQARRRRRGRSRRVAPARARGRARRAGRADRQRRHRLARRSRGRADDVHRPRRRRGAAPGGDRRGVVRGRRHLHVSGYALAPRSGQVRGDPGDRARARPRGAGQHRPLVLERDPRLRSWSDSARSSRSSRPTSSSRTRRRTAIVGGPLAGCTWILKRGAAGASFDGVERAPARVEEVVDSTGAGDAFAAGWLVGGPDLALEAGARCVQLAGSMPEAR